MNKLRMAFRAVLFVSITLTLASLTQAQGNTRSWVSGLGDDMNTCVHSHPCKTFAGAYSKTSIGGEIDALDSGSFGPVAINKSITIDGTGTLASVTASAGNGITINITDPNDSKTVRLRGLSLNGLRSGQNGIVVEAALKVSIEDCVIDGFAGNGIDVRAGTVFVRNTTIRNNGNASITVANVSGASAGLSNVALVFNAFAPAGDIQKFDNVVTFGRFNKPPRPTP